MNRLHRILMITPGEFPPDGRIEKEIRVLTGMGHKVAILTHNLGNRPVEDLHDGIRIYRIPFLPWKIGEFPYGKLINHPFPLNPVWLYNIAYSARRFRADALHVHDFQPLLPALAVAGALKLQVVFDSHENYPEYLSGLNQPRSWFNLLLNNAAVYKIFQRIALRLVSDLIVTNDPMGGRMCRVYHFKGNCHTIPNYCSKDFYQAGEGHEYTCGSPLKIGYLGGLDRTRGLFETLEVFEKLKDQPVELIVAGGGVCENELREMARTRQLNVRFLGNISRQETHEFLRSVHIGLISNVSSVNCNYASPNKVFEYACYVPVLARSLIGVNPFFRKYRMGLVYQNEAQLLKIIEELLRNPSVLINMAVEARRFAFDHLFEAHAESIFRKIYT